MKYRFYIIHGILWLIIVMIFLPIVGVESEFIKKILHIILILFGFFMVCWAAINEYVFIHTKGLHKKNNNNKNKK